MSRKERVKAVYDFINQYGNDEKNFGILYSKLLEEFELEMELNSDLKTNLYLNNLRQTKWKQADTYISISARRPKKGAPREFKDFVSNFRQDTTWSAVQKPNQHDL